LFKEIIEV